MNDTRVICCFYSISFSVKLNDESGLGHSLERAPLHTILGNSPERAPLQTMDRQRIRLLQQRRRCTHLSKQVGRHANSVVVKVIHLNDVSS